MSTHGSGGSARAPRQRRVWVIESDPEIATEIARYLTARLPYLLASGRIDRHASDHEIDTALDAGKSPHLIIVSGQNPHDMATRIWALLRRYERADIGLIGLGDPASSATVDIAPDIEWIAPPIDDHPRLAECVDALLRERP